MTFFVILGALAAYFFPTIIAIQRKHRNHGPILLSNLLLGWTAIGWIVALIWATTDNVKVENVFNLGKYKLSIEDAANALKELRMLGAKKENQGMDNKNEIQAIEASSDAVVIAGAINNLADAIREHARAMKGEEEIEADEQFDLAGEPI